MKQTIGKTYTFSAAHHLPKVPSNHPCYKTHGHNYKVEIQITGEVDPMLGWVTDFNILDEYLKPLIKKLDHNYLNDTIDNPTAENLALYFIQYLKNTAICCGVSIKAVVWETDRCWACYEDNA